MYETRTLTLAPLVYWPFWPSCIIDFFLPFMKSNHVLNQGFFLVCRGPFNVMKLKVAFIWPPLAFLLIQIPCYARIIDLKDLMGTKDNLTLGKFKHNMTTCTFRFHGYAFMKRENVTLTKNEYFKDRTNCSVEFFNLPKGELYLRFGKNDVSTEMEIIEDK